MEALRMEALRRRIANYEKSLAAREKKSEERAAGIAKLERAGQTRKLEELRAEKKRGDAHIEIIRKNLEAARKKLEGLENN